MGGRRGGRQEASQALAYVVIIGGAGLYLLYNWSVEVLGAARAGTLIYTQMIFVAFFAWLVLGETIEWYHYLGAGLIIVGVVLVTLMRPKAKAAGAASTVADRDPHHP